MKSQITYALRPKITYAGKAVGLILGVGIPLRNKAIKKRRENMKEKGNEEK